MQAQESSLVKKSSRPVVVGGNGLLVVLLLWAWLLTRQVVPIPTLIKDPAGGADFFCRAVRVVFTTSATESMRNVAIASVQGTITTQAPTLHTYLLTLSGRCDARTVFHAIERLRGTLGVQFAEPAYPGPE